MKVKLISNKSKDFFNPDIPRKVINDTSKYSKNAVRWQIWMALLTYVLLRFIAFSNKWQHSFRRLFTLLRGVLWSKFNILAIMDSYGTAGGQKRMRAVPEQADLPGFSKKLYGTAHG